MRGFALAVLMMLATPVALAADPAYARTAEQVLARNAQARGGLAAWRKIHTMVWLGHVEPASPRPEAPRPKFVMHLQEPNRTRFEVRAGIEDYTRIFDGEHGWKQRPGTDGRPQVIAFTPAEAAFSKSEFVIGGPLLDAKAKGVKVSLDGIDRVNDRKAYRLSLTLADGAQRKVWVDVQTNLEIRMDRPAQSGPRPGAPIATYYRDWRRHDGVMLPHEIATAALPGDDSAAAPRPDVLVIDELSVNVPLEAETFAMPASPFRHGKGQVRIESGVPVSTPGP